MLDELVDCEAVLWKLLENITPLLGERCLEVATTYFNLGVLYHKAGKLKEAFEMYEVSKVMRKELDS